MKQEYRTFLAPSHHLGRSLFSAVCLATSAPNLGEAFFFGLGRASLTS